MKSTFTLLFAITLLSFGCSRSRTNHANPEAQTEPRMVGDDRDEHGCIGSAGYTWSAIRNECIRLFEVGIRLDAKDASLDQTLSAFVVFKSIDHEGNAEVFLPRSQGGGIFKRQSQPSSPDGVWKGSNLVLKLSKGVFTLEDANKKLLYQGQ